jgi:hypothetical protein
VRERRKKFRVVVEACTSLTYVLKRANDPKMVARAAEKKAADEKLRKEEEKKAAKKK